MSGPGLWLLALPLWMLGNWSAGRCVVRLGLTWGWHPTVPPGSVSLRAGWEREWPSCDSCPLPAWSGRRSYCLQSRNLQFPQNERWADLYFHLVSQHPAANDFIAFQLALCRFKWVLSWASLAFRSEHFSQLVYRRSQRTASSADNLGLLEGRVDCNEPGSRTWVDAHVCLRQGRDLQLRKIV